MAKSTYFVSVRMYTEPGKPDITDDPSANTLIHGSANSLGVSDIIIRAKRQQFSDSRLYLPRGDSKSYLLLSTHAVLTSIYIAAIWVNISNWKSNVLFGLALAYIGYQIWEKFWPLLMDKARAYWRDDETIN